MRIKPSAKIALGVIGLLAMNANSVFATTKEVSKNILFWFIFNL